MSAIYKTKSPCYYCHQCGMLISLDVETFPFCSKEHADESAAAAHREMTSGQIKLWAKFINHQLAAWSALFELVTGNKPPKIKEILAVISGH